MKSKRGFTLLEIIIILAVLAFAIPAVLMSFARMVGTGADAQTVTVATNLAEEKMEGLIRGKLFNELVSEGPSPFTGDFSTYDYQVIVQYVNPGALNTPVAGPTDFKRVQVIITRDGMTDFDVTLNTILTNI